MTRRADYAGELPRFIYVVQTSPRPTEPGEDSFRVFVKEGFALVYLQQQLKENRRAEIFVYSPATAGT